MKSVFGLAFVAAIFLVAGCDSNRVFEDQKDFENRIWAVTDTARFEFRVNDIVQKYNLYYSVRNSIDYPYSRLFTNYAILDSLGRPVLQQLSTAMLFDLKTGTPQGRSGLGDLYDHREVIREDFQFSQPGLYHVKLYQAMRTDSLTGILAVGFRLETAKNKP
jgi:gliding motility-associated lipoprotein GldH